MRLRANFVEFSSTKVIEKTAQEDWRFLSHRQGVIHIYNTNSAKETNHDALA